MANEQNLKPTSKRSKNEARELGRKGGIASGKARRERKTLREELLYLLEREIDIQQKDGTPRRMAAREAISTGLIERAIKGDANAFKTIRDTIGETVPVELKVAAAVTTSEFDVRDIPDEVLFAAADAMQKRAYEKRQQQNEADE